MSWSPARTTEVGLPLCPWHVSASPPALGSAGCTGGKQLNDYLPLEISFFSAIMSLGQETSLRFVNDILVSYCCWIRLPQVRRLKQCKCIVSHSEGQKSPRGLMGSAGPCFSSSCIPWHVATRLQPVSIVPSLTQTRLPPFCKHHCNDHPSNRG